MGLTLTLTLALTLNPNLARKLATLAQARARRNPVVMLGDLNGDVEDEAVAMLLASGGLTPMSD